MRVKRELEGGWFQYLSMPLPALLTIQSGINTLRYATLKGIMAAKKKEITKVAAPAGAGSRQKIVALVRAAEVQADRDDRRVARRGREGARQAAARRSEGPVILVIAEQKDGKLNRASWEAIAAAQQLSGGAMPMKVAVAGQNVSGVAGELAQGRRGGSDRGRSCGARALHARCLRAGAAAGDHAGGAGDGVLLRTRIRRAISRPTLATRLDRALVTDVIGVKQAGGAATFSRPMFQGKLTADVVPQGPTPHLITIQIGAFRADAAQKGASAAPVTAAAVTIDESKLRQKPEAPFQEAKQAVDLSQAERIVSVGRGIKSQENIAVAEQLAKAFGAELAASRPICDNGWLPMERQIGSSGQTVAPKLYVALGISGAIQHLVGMKGARTIVAINKDAEAPIFEVADYGIQGRSVRAGAGTDCRTAEILGA